MDFSKEQWSLFLDRDGVINHRLPGAYVQHPSSFEFIAGVPEAIAQLQKLFQPIVVVTNQQGIGKGLMTATDLNLVHQKMKESLALESAFIDQVYYCADLASAQSNYRKPETGMAFQAQLDFPMIRFDRSVIVGDSWSDMEFGRQLGMYTVFVTTKEKEAEVLKERGIEVNATFSDLPAFAKACFHIG